MQESPPKLTLKPLIITLVLFVFLAIFIKAQTATIAQVPASAPDTVFSGERAFNMLQQLTKEQVPHPVDSPANRVVEKRLVGLLQGMGYKTDIQQADMCRTRGSGISRCARVRNVIVNIEGSGTGKGILLAAHYDSVPAGPGGSDAGAAVGALLEVARLLSISEKPLNRIVLLFNEGEEFGLFGAKAFMEQHPLAKELQLAINVEARGSGGRSVMFETGEDSGWLVNHYAQTTPAPMSSSLFYEVYKYLPNDTDLTIFKEHGLQGLNFAHAERLPHYHTPLDNLANLDRGSIQHHGDNVWGVLSNIKDIDLSSAKKGNLVYTDVMGMFVISWDESTSLVVSVLFMLALIAALVMLSKQQQLNLKQFSKGLLAVIIVLVISALAALAVQKLTQLISGGHAPWNVNTLPMQIALWSAVTLFALLSAKWFAKKAAALDMALAIVTIWTLLGLLTSIWMPGISFLFMIPTAAGLIALLVMIKWPDVKIPALIAMTIIAAMTFMPIAYNLEVMMTYRMSVAIGLILGFVVSALLPLMTLQSEASADFKKLALALTAIMLVTVGWTSLQPAHSPWMPQHLNVLYVQNDNDESFILAGHQNNQLTDSLSAALPGETQLTHAFPWIRWQFHTVATSSTNENKPRLEVLSSTTTDSGKKVTVRITASNDNFADLQLLIPSDSGLDTIKSGDHTLSFKGKKANLKDYYRHHCRGQACKETELTLTFSGDKAVKVTVISLLDTLPSVHQHLVNKKGDNVTSRQDGDQSMILAEYTL